MATSGKDVKGEIKDELKEEIKEETKEESDDELKTETDAKDKKSKKEKRNRDDDDDGDRKDKKKKKSEKDGDGDEKAVKLQVDLADCPKTLIIKHSGHKAVDGQYTLQEILSKGRPAYEKPDVKKPMFLYVVKGFWKIGPTLGEKCAFMMQLPCVGLPTPCEPYPKLWRGFKKDAEGSKIEYTAHGMRIVDLETLEALGSMEYQPAPSQPVPSVALAGGDAAAKDADQAPPAPKKSHKKQKPEVDSKPEKATPSPKPQAAKKEEVESEVVKALRGEVEKMKPSELKKKMKDIGCSVEMIREAEDTDKPKEAYKKAIITQAIANETKPQEEPDEDSDSSSESDSDSDAGVAPVVPSGGAGGAGQSSSDSSSSSDSEAPQRVNTAAAAAVAAAKAKAVAKAKAKANADQASGLEEKVREQLNKLTNRPKELREKLEALKTKLRSQSQISGEHIEIMIKKLEKDFASTQPVAKTTTNNIGGGGAAKGRGPQTPPEGHASAALKKQEGDNKRYPDPPEKGKLKNAWGGARDKEWGCDRIRFVDSLPPSEAPKPMITLTSIENFRGLGAQLWFQQPGAIVHCDVCERGVSQIQGQLQGAPERSQFAQSSFVCCECMEDQMR